MEIGTIGAGVSGAHGVMARHATYAPLNVTRLTSLDELPLLREEWTALYERAVAPSPPQRFEFVSTAWLECQARGAQERVVLTARRGGELVGLWALCIERKGRRLITNPGFGAGEEYAGPLILPGPQGAEVAEALLNAALTLGDALKTTVVADHPLKNVLRRRFRIEVRVASPTVTRGDHPDFDAWLNTKTGSFRKGLRYDRRSLSKLGVLTLHHGVKGDPETLALIDWMFSEKRRWLQAKGLKSRWIEEQASSTLMRAIFARHDAEHSCFEVFALRLDNTPLAAAVCLNSRHSMELFFFVHNREFSKYSPGNLLLEDLIRICFRRNLDFDFRITQEVYKMRWANSKTEFSTIIVASNLRGALFVLSRWRNRFRVELGQARRTLIDRLKRRRAS